MAEPEAADPGARYLLVGVSTVGERRFAFFEDGETGEIIRARVGQVLGERALTAITLDSVGHAPLAARDSEPEMTEVGQTLSGEARRATGETAASSSSGGAARRRGGGGSDDHEERVRSVLEALRREREQELNR